jgi:DNA-binding MarR family transcriptional regulator
MKVKETNKDKFMSLLHSLVRGIKAEAERCSETCGGVTEKELGVISFVGEKQNVKMTEIAEDIETPMSTLTNIVDKLVDKKILVREHSSDDRRSINVTLSASGKLMYKTLVERKKQIAEKLLSQFNEKDQALFLEHLSSLVASLNKK